jgi:hypothetical protein
VTRKRNSSQVGCAAAACIRHIQAQERPVPATMQDNRLISFWQTVLASIVAPVQ